MSLVRCILYSPNKVSKQVTLFHLHLPSMNNRITISFRKQYNLLCMIYFLQLLDYSIPWSAFNTTLFFFGKHLMTKKNFNYQVLTYSDYTNHRLYQDVESAKLPNKPANQREASARKRVKQNRPQFDYLCKMCFFHRLAYRFIERSSSWPHLPETSAFLL